MHLKYCALLEGLLREGVLETNERTGKRVKIFPHPAAMTIDLRHGRLPLPGNRRVFPGVAATELAWFLIGSQSVKWLQDRGVHIWDKFANTGAVPGAYGWRWAHSFGRDQITDLVEALREDPTNRRTYVSTWDPSCDGLLTRGQSNVPCPVGFTAHVVNGMVNVAVFVRSSDVFVGLPYDVMGFALLTTAIAMSLGVAPGFLHMTLAHSHLYESHWDMAVESLGKVWAERPAMPNWPIDRIRKDPDGYIMRVKELSKEVRHHDVTYKPELVV